jgi:uncharacterized protein (DUF4415 family)
MKKKLSAESSPRESLVVMSESDIRRFAKSPEAQAMSGRIRARGSEPSAEDLAEIPELTDEQLAAMRPAKESVTIRLDRDVLDWFKSQPGHYQTRINAILRYYVQHRKKGKGA